LTEDGARRDEVRSPDGTPIGILTGGSGPPLLLVHGGLSGMVRFGLLWRQLAPDFRLTAMDRRGRGSSGDAAAYDVHREYEDVRAVAEHVAAETGEPVDAFGHSFGGIAVLGAAASGAPLRRLALYEPPGPPTVPREWLDRVRGYLEAGQTGRAVASFLTEVIGLTREQVEELRRSAPGGDDVLDIAFRTLGREGEALAALDLADLARQVAQPALLLLGTASPAWAGEVVRVLAENLPSAEVAELPGAGHEGVDTAAAVVAERLRGFLLGV
jgi:pimeloyl-ACP methyl ester carboxylesterase